MRTAGGSHPRTLGDRRPHVVYLDHVARLSGGEIALERLLGALRPHVDPLVILGEDGPLVDRLRGLQVPVEVVEMSARSRDARKDAMQASGVDAGAALDVVRYTTALARRLRRLRPDLVHTNSLKSAVYGSAAARLARVPAVWHVRDRIAADYLPGPAVRGVRIAARVLPAALIANSRATLATVAPPAGRRRPVTAVVADSVLPAPPMQPPTGGPFRVGLVGRLSPWKGQHVFLEAFARAYPSDDAEAWLIGDVMFGESEYADRLHRLVHELGIAERVVFRGFREDIWGELARLHVLVHSSVIAEPFGQVVIEGMAAGLPVVASAAGGPAEIVTADRDGLLVPPGDVTALAAALSRLRADGALRARLGAAGRETAADYRPERSAEQVLAVYDRLLRR